MRQDFKSWVNNRKMYQTEQHDFKEILLALVETGSSFISSN